jgi:hypothetical protein
MNNEREGAMRPLFFALLSCICFTTVTRAQEKKSDNFPAVFHNERLKALSLPDHSITGDSHSRLVSGFWVSESKDPTKTLVFPQQVRIRCTAYNKTCTETSVTIAPTPQMVSIQEIDDEDYDINTWDAHGLLASYGGEELSASPCQRHVLTMDFDSGAVSVSDIPTRRKGCEAFTETDSYRLVRGNYYVDTSPGNDADKPKN